MNIINNKRKIDSIIRDVKKIKSNNKNYDGGDDDNEEDDDSCEDDEDDEDDEKNEENEDDVEDDDIEDEDIIDIYNINNYYNNKNNKNDKKSNKKEVKKIFYFDSSDSSDSEYDFDDYTSSDDFALNLLIKKHRHNTKKSNLEVAKLYHDQILKLETKLKQREKNKNKTTTNELKILKERIDSCKELENRLRDDIEYYKTKFSFKKFFYKLKEDNIEKNDSLNNLLFTIIYPNKNIIRSSTNEKQDTKITSVDKEFEELYDQENINIQSGLKYFKTLKAEDKKFYLEKLKKVKQTYKEEEKRPNYIKILDCETTENNKSIILQKINSFENLKGSSEYNKLKPWINKIMRVPFGKYIKPPVLKTDGSKKIKEYLKNVRNQLDNGIYGHDTTKDQLIKILAHTITNPTEGGNVFALQGPPGVGKTALIQDGIAKALGRPYSFISLGGATDACFLEGHDYTYEGSNHGRIVEVLQQAGYMNPVIYFDELDKVSETSKGEEIINILMHITDSTQNHHYNDKYFGGIDFDLSKAIIIFSFNDEHKISRILRDRMKIIRVKGYKMLDKLKISKNYLIPKLIKQIGLEDINIEFTDNILEYLIDNYTNEGGVRRLKELLNDILLEINLRKLEDTRICNKKIKDKLVLTVEMLEEELIKKKRKIEHIKINSQPKVGVVNGLWANELGIGGLVPIECCWIPSREKLQLELTGMQGKVMKESMIVARTIAWRILPEDIKEKINTKWKDSFDYGIHVHCPDGATPKDGPSAGGAITSCLISLLTNIPINNKIAMTGEINLKGNITAIGGLEEKIFGAKKAGAELVLCPSDNKQDLNEIKEKYVDLFDKKFQAKQLIIYGKY